MTTKLTLTMEDKVIESAKKYAHKRGKSLSHLVENYFKSITDRDEKEEIFSPKVLKLLGSVKLPEEFDYKTSLSDSLKKKYSK